MKTGSIAGETSPSTTHSDSNVRQTNKTSSFLSYTTMNNKHIFNDIDKQGKETTKPFVLVSSLQPLEQKKPMAHVLTFVHSNV